MKIILDATEEKVRNILLQYAKEFAGSGNPDVTLRFTGGWVRDKLLGRTSHDIDVAIDKSTGEAFATGLHNYMLSKDLAETKVHKVAINPEKSKHLETATTRICGLDIDFVNLRSEEYVNDSRVPSKIKFGTPQEDAFRRDATLNALFYNLTTGSVEDFTGKGLEDLRNGVLRTPLNPSETFNDDPLRVLRLLRFVGQLGFTVAPETYQAMHGDIVGTKIQSKVSGERVGKEIEKLLGSEHSAMGMKCLADLKLAPYIFAMRNEEGDPKQRMAAVSLEDFKSRLDSMEWYISKSPEFNKYPSSEMSILWLANLLQDLPDEDIADITQGGLRLTRVAKDGCLKLVRSAPIFDNLRTALHQNSVRRVDLGLFVRACGPLWTLAIPFNAMRLHAEHASPDDAYRIRDIIIDNHLESAYSLKPLVAGKPLMTLLSIKPGPEVAKILDSELKYQLQHPDATADDIKAWLVNEFGSR